VDLEDSVARLRHGRCGVKRADFGSGEAGACTNFAGELWAGEGMGKSDLFSEMFCPEILLLSLWGFGKAQSGKKHRTKKSSV